jgi:hypothetical protein
MFAEQTQLQVIFETDAVTPALVMWVLTQYALSSMTGSLSSL